MRFRRFAFTASILLAPLLAAAQDLPPGYWSRAESQPILDKTLVVRLAPNLSDLTPDEKAAVEKLLEAGGIMQRIYESSLHHQALQAQDALRTLDKERGSPPETQNLLQMYRLFQGPIATTLENKRLPFLPVDSIVPGKNLYPWGVEKGRIEAFLAAVPAQRGDLLNERTVVRLRSTETVERDLAALARQPVLAQLHPELRAALNGNFGSPAAAVSDPSGSKSAPPQRPAEQFYAIPYALAYGDELAQIFPLLYQAADLLEPTDADFAGYLRHRARDFLSNDYEAGDVAWVTGNFAKLNAEIGAYETYDDELFAAKATFGFSLLKRDAQRSDALRAAIQGLQEFENSLPYAPHKKVREGIPVNVYDVIADFGQARGTNTATILPNDPRTARKFGRTILMRYNILTHPEIAASNRQAWQAALDERHWNDYQVEGNFYRTLWHEIGHYLGVDATRDGRDLQQALLENNDTFEEMKADLVSLFVADALRKRGYYDDTKLRGVYASGIGRTLNKTRPRRDQPYQTMQLMQMNFFLEKHLLDFDAKTGKLRIDYPRYHATVGELLRQILELQANGDKAAADRFIDRYTKWDPSLQEVVAKNMRATETSRYRLVRYAALGE
jgi:hypothetical protein